MTASESRWGAIVEGFEAHLEHQRQLLSEDRFDEIQQLEIPADASGDVPATIVPRIEAILQETLEIEQAVLTRMDEIVRETRAIIDQRPRRRVTQGRSQSDRSTYSASF